MTSFEQIQIAFDIVAGTVGLGFLAVIHANVSDIVYYLQLTEKEIRDEAYRAFVKKYWSFAKW